MTALGALLMNAKLTQAIADACQAALKSGATKEDLVACLNRAVELLENSDD